MLEFLQHCQVPDVINVVVIDIQDTKRFLCNTFRFMKREEFMLQLLQWQNQTNIYYTANPKPKPNVKPQGDSVKGKIMYITF